MALSLTRRAVLLEHLDRPRGVPVTASSRRMVTVNFLIRDRMLRGDKKVRPARTFLTEFGREMMCRSLAEEADSAGREHFNAKLSNADVGRLRQRYGQLTGCGMSRGAALYEVSAMFPNISMSQIRRIADGEQRANKEARRTPRDRTLYRREYRRLKREERPNG